MSTNHDRFNVSLPGEPLLLSEFPYNDLNAVMRLHELYTAAVYAWRNHAASYNSLSEQFCQTMEALRSEAIERDWCDDFEHFIDSLPPAADVRTPTRDKTWEGHLTYTITFPVRVEARTQEQASERLTNFYFHAFADKEVYQQLPDYEYVTALESVVTEMIDKKITGEAQ